MYEMSLIPHEILQSELQDEIHRRLPMPDESLIVSVESVLYMDFFVVYVYLSQLSLKTLFRILHKHVGASSNHLH